MAGCPFPHDAISTDRRRLLLGLGAAGGALAAGAVVSRTQAQSPNVATAPVSDAAKAQVPFYGPHQAGILNQRPAAGMVVAFNVLADTPDDLDRLFRRLTERIAFLTEGGALTPLDPKLPPVDSGILGPIVTPDDLTITVGLGASLFENRPWLAPHKPRVLQRMPHFPNDALDQDLCHGDLALQICANTPDTAIHALRDVLKNLSDQLVLRWKQEGTVPVQPVKAGRGESARNFLGFRDGSANPDATDAGLMQAVVWVGGDHDEPAWARNGTYQVVRIIRNFVERWDRTPLGEQERIMGRAKMSGAPLSGGADEYVLPDFSADPKGKLTPLDAHIRRANPRTPGSEQSLMLRRPFNYSNGVSKNGQLDQGLLFICFQADVEKSFIAVQERLNGETLEEYIKPVGGGFFFAIPGARAPGDYLGRTLLDAVRAGPVSRPI